MLPFCLRVLTSGGASDSGGGGIGGGEPGKAATSPAAAGPTAAPDAKPDPPPSVDAQGDFLMPHQLQDYRQVYNGRIHTVASAIAS